MLGTVEYVNTSLEPGCGSPVNILARAEYLAEIAEIMRQKEITEEREKFGYLPSGIKLLPSK